MHKTIIQTALVLATTLPAATAARAAADDDGRDAYQAFKCSQCHGYDAKSPAKSSTPNIAGLERVYVARKTKQMLAEHSHAEAAGPSCGEPPTEAQILSIAEWVSLQPR